MPRTLYALLPSHVHAVLLPDGTCVFNASRRGGSIVVHLVDRLADREHLLDRILGRAG